MRMLLLWPCLALSTMASCHDPSTAPLPKTLVRTGTEFGECGGWCYKELEIQGTLATFQLRQHYPGTAESLGAALISPDKWRHLERTIDMDALAAVAGVIGCPDCSDGGAEWIEVEHAGARKRVTFEWCDSVPAIQPLVDAARELREEILSMPRCPPR